jgi:NADH-quinone oxidoreductase subunit F
VAGVLPVEVLTRIENGTGRKEDLDTLHNLCDFMWLGKTHCALAPGAVEPLKSALRYFLDDFEQHIDHGCCSYKQNTTQKTKLKGHCHG